MLNSIMPLISSVPGTEAESAAAAAPIQLELPAPDVQVLSPTVSPVRQHVVAVPIRRQVKVPVVSGIDGNGRSPRGIEDGLDDHGGSEAGESAVLRALRWLKFKQVPS